jgi:esterase/lipase superfamily enzyme
MKLTVKIYLLCFFLAAIGCSKNNNVKKSDPEFIVKVVGINAPSLLNSIVTVDTIQNAKVFLPPYYNSDSTTKFPVVYFIHGYSDNYASDYGIFKAAYDEMVAEEINEFIIVSVNSNCNIGGTFCVNSPVLGNWEEHISDEVINYIDENFRTINSKESRGVSGFSMGGFGALFLGLRHADVYNLVYAVAPGVLMNVDFKSAYNRWSSDGGTFLNAYGAAFSPNLDIKYPHAEKPVFDNSLADNLIIERWLDGFGNFDKKVSDYLAGSNRIKKFGIDYGSSDYYTWIPRGCEYLMGVFDNNAIPYEKNKISGGIHEVNLEQVRTYMLPFFSENLSFE